jgi:hypothetical protein
MVKRSNEMLLPFYFRDIGAEPSSTPLVCAQRGGPISRACSQQRIWVSVGGAFGRRRAHVTLGQSYIWRAVVLCSENTHTHASQRKRGGADCVQVGGGRAAQLAAAWSAGVRVLCVLIRHFHDPNRRDESKRRGISATASVFILMIPTRISGRVLGAARRALLRPGGGAAGDAAAADGTSRRVATRARGDDGITRM